MSSFLSFLSNRQIGGAQRNRELHASSSKLNFDNQLSRLVNYSQDVYPSYVQNHSVPPFVCEFRKDAESDLLALANEEGEILLVDTERSKIIKSFIAHDNAVFDISWLPDKNHMLTVSGDHSARLFDMNTCQYITAYHGHTASIKSVDVCYTESAVFATGSRDGHIAIWDRREKCGIENSKPSNFISYAHSRVGSARKRSAYFTNSSVSAVVFQDSTHLVSSGVADGLIKVWDLRKTHVKSRIYSPQYEMDYSSDKSAGHGCTSLVFDSSHKKLYGAITSNKIYQFDCHTYSDKVLIYTGLKCNTYFVKLDLSCDDQYLLCGSSNTKGYIWNTNNPGAPLFALPGHRAEVTSVAWCPYSITKLATVGDDFRLRVWKMRNSEKADCFVENQVTPKRFGNTEVPQCKDWGSGFSPIPQRRRRNNSSQNPKTPVIKSITNFFSPVTPSSLQEATSEKLTSPESEGSPSSMDSASPQLRSPCKAISDNSLVFLTDAPTDAKSSPNGKENNTVLSATDELSSTMKTAIQVKRKLSTHQLGTCRYHPEGCGRTKGHTRCGKRIILTPDKHNIKKYFIASSSE